MTLSLTTRVVSLGFIAALLAIALPLTARADDGSDHSDTDAGVSAEVKTEVRVENRGPGDLRTLFKRDESRRDQNDADDDSDDDADDDNNNDRRGSDVRGTGELRHGDDDGDGDRKRGRENAVERIQAHLLRYVHILEAAIGRMDTLADRIQSRADKMEDGGADVSEAEGFLATVHAELDAASADLLLIEAEAETDVVLNASSTPATVFEGVRSLLTSVREHLRNAHTALKNAVQSLRAQLSADVDADTESD